MSFCSSCGSKLEDGVKFCSKCGTTVADSSAPIISSSKFSGTAVQQVNAERIAASRCPRCGVGMAVVIKRSRFGLALVILGILLTPAFGIGIPIFVVGYLMRWGGKGRACYQCPGCNYSTA
jgi:uncharacterized membrane protein YvbJ